MTDFVVVDCSVYLAALLPNEPHIVQANQLLGIWGKQGFLSATPILLRYEIISTTRRNVFKGRITEQRGQEIIQTVLSRPMRVFSSMRLMQRAYQVAREHNLPTAYDAQYLAVAEHLGCEFWTADEKLVNSVSAQLPWVKWIGGGLPL